MPEIGLQPVSQLTPEQLPSALDRNFTFIQDALRTLPNVDSGFEFVLAGQMQVTTRLSEVLVILVSLALDPVAGAAFVVAQPGTFFGTPADILIRVLKADYTQSALNVYVSWLAIGIP